MFNEKLFKTQLAYFDDINYSEKVEFMPGFEVSDKIIKKALIDFSLEWFLTGCASNFWRILREEELIGNKSKNNFKILINLSKTRHSHVLENMRMFLASIKIRI